MTKHMSEYAYLVWVYSGEGWNWYGYDSLDKAVNHESYGSERIITKSVKIIIKELEDGK